MAEQKPKSQKAHIVKIVVVAAAMAALWFFLLQQTSIAIVERDYLFWIAPIIFVIAFVPITGLASMLFGPRMYFFWSFGLPFMYLLFFPINIYAVLSIAFLFFGLWRAYHRTQFELHNNIKFAPSQIMRRVSSIVILAILLMISINAYANVSTELSEDPSGFYTRVARLVTKGVLPVVERQFEDFRPSQSLDQFIVESFRESQPGFEDLPTQDRNDQVLQSRERILDQLGISAQGTEPLSDITQRAIEEKIREAASPRYSWLIPIIYSLIIFSLLRLLSVFVRLIAQAWGIFLFWMLRKSGFFKITTTQILAESVDV